MKKRGLIILVVLWLFLGVVASVFNEGGGGESHGEETVTEQHI